MYSQVGRLPFFAHLPPLAFWKDGTGIAGVTRHVRNCEVRLATSILSLLEPKISGMRV